jgi:phosphonate transport system permease protein
MKPKYTRKDSSGIRRNNQNISSGSPQTTKNYSSGRPRTTKNLCLWLPPFKGGREGDKEGDKGDGRINAIDGREIKQPLSFMGDRIFWFLAFGVALTLAFQQTGIFSQEIINQNGLPLVLEFLQAILHPDISWKFLQVTGTATLKTLGFAVCGTTFSVFIGSLCGVLVSEVWAESFFQSKTDCSHKLFLSGRWILRQFLAIIRAIHEMIWGLFFVNIFGLDPLVGILAIAIPFGAMTAKVFSEIIDETPRQPLRTLLNAGVHPLNAFLYTIVPQAFPNLLSYAFYRFECSLRAAAVLGIIGAGGLGYEIFLSLQSLRYQQLWTLFWALILLNGTISLWSALLRQRIGAPSRLDLNVGKLAKTQLKQNRNKKRDRLIQFSLLLGLILLPLSFWSVGADFSKLWAPRTGQLLWTILTDAFPPNLSQLPEYFRLSLQTLAMSFLAITGAGLGGIMLSFPAAFKPPKSAKWVDIL